ncbi:MAG: lumazine-binding protein [Bacteroidetes bacterium]|nr:lumazine-binding protein [Bacteroidota bacterium]
MKKVLTFALVAVIAVAFMACGGSKNNTPEGVAEEFAKALNDKKWDDAKKLGTEATGQMIDMMSSMAGLGGDEEKVKEFKDFKAEVKDNAAVVKYLADGKEEKLDLVKKDDKWLVDMKKEADMGDAMNDMGEAIGEGLNDLGEAIGEGVDDMAEGVKEGLTKEEGKE